MIYFPRLCSALMKRDFHEEWFEVKSLVCSDEFAPRNYNRKVIDLHGFGVPQVPVIEQVAYLRVDEASPWHTHRNCIEFVYCTAGACVYESEGRRFSLMPGMMFVSRPHEPHRQLDCPKGYSTFCMHFKPTAGEEIRWFAERFARLPRLFSCSRSVLTSFSRIFALAENGDMSIGARIRMQTVVHSLWLEILDSTALSVTRKIPEVFGAIAARMRREPERDYTLDELVSEAGVSKASFITMFKTAHGLAPHAYHLHCRIENSKELLKSGLSIKAVADSLGFPSSQHFSRTFRSFVGETPMKWLAGRSV